MRLYRWHVTAYDPSAWHTPYCDVIAPNVTSALRLAIAAPSMRKLEVAMIERKESIDGVWDEALAEVDELTR